MVPTQFSSLLKVLVQDSDIHGFSVLLVEGVYWWEIKSGKKCKQKCQTIYIPKSENNFQLTHQDKVRQGHLYKFAFFFPPLVVFTALMHLQDVKSHT